jgi:anti-sigma factor ChrR (cupin superfamily)
MTHEDLQELAALAAAGALDGADLQRAAALAEDPAFRTERVTFEAALAHTAAACVVPRRPRAEMRAAILDRISRTPQQTRTPSPPAAQAAATVKKASTPSVPSGFQFIGAEEGPWMPAPVPGGRFKQLSVNPAAGYALLLMDLPPQARYPEHDHLGTEELYVLSGDLVTEGRTMGPGDYLRADPGSHHGELYTEHGCRALMIVPLAALAGAT